MQINDHSLRQLDDAYLERLGEGSLRVLSGKLVADLKEARERLNQNSRNSSRPPSSEAPWERPEAGEAADDRDAPAQEPEPEPAEGEGGTPAPEPAPAPAPAPGAHPRRAGKQAGAPGHGRAAPERVDAVEHHAPSCCAGCAAPLAEAGAAHNGHYEVDWVRHEAGWQVRWTKHLWHEAECACGHLTRAEPFRESEEGVDLGGFRLVGPGLATLVVALALRYRLSRARIREFLGDWLGVWLSVGALHEVVEAAGAAVAPAEAELIEAVRDSGLLHADETPWPEQRTRAQMSLWLWVFTAARVTLYYISHRGQELARNLLEGASVVLMSDGWQAYRWLGKRLRCWAHLKRKAVGLAESFSPQARAFGQDVLALWAALREAVHRAREGPPGPIRADFEGRLDAFRARCEAMRGSSHKKTRELAGEFLNDWDAIFAVLDDPRWPLTNNEAERALRHWVILRKLTHGTRTERGSRGLALLASVIDTCRQRGHSPWDYLRTALSHRRQGLALPPLPVVGG